MNLLGSKSEVSTTVFQGILLALDMVRQFPRGKLFFFLILLSAKPSKARFISPCHCRGFMSCACGIVVVFVYVHGGNSSAVAVAKAVLLLPMS